MNQQTTQAMINQQPTIETTRRELLNFLAQQHEQEERAESTAADRRHVRRKAASDTPDGFNWSSLVEAGFSSWWRDHPALRAQRRPRCRWLPPVASHRR